MIQITKELAEAVVKSCEHDEFGHCVHCYEVPDENVLQHTPECIVTRAKLLLELEWGIKS